MTNRNLHKKRNWGSYVTERKVIRMKSTQLRERGVYEILDWLETEKPHCIKLFWSCVFEDHILHLYPNMRLLKNNLLDAMTEKKEMSEDLKEKEEKKKTGGEKCEKKRVKKMSEEEDEEPGPSTQSTPSKKKKPEKPCDGSPIRKGEKKPIWERPFFRTQLPVTCGDKKGILYRNKLPKGEKCILAKGSWFTPQAFEDFGGKKRSKKWKESIRCQNTPLQKLIEEGHLKAPSSPCKQRRMMSSRTSSSEDMSSDSDTDSDTEEEEEEEEEEEDEEEDEEEEEEEEENDEEEPEKSGQAAVGNGDMSEFPGLRLSVTCGSATGTLQKDRFASGTSGKCIRTASGWLTPVEFTKEDQALTSSSWERSILCQGEPLSDLIKRKVLESHSLQDVEEQRNDDNCSVCGKRGHLLCCDRCPRAFHTECHLPAVEERLLGDVWLCTYCVLTQFQGSRIARERSLRQALDCRTSDFMLQCHYLLLMLYHSDEGHIFSCDPRDKPRYKEFTQKPMWLKKVAEKLQEGQYSTVRQFKSDIQLIFQNCATFNRENEVGPVGARLKQLFETEFQQVFSVKNDSDASSGGPHNV
ncbi:nuclear body protein SP140-like protein isoform X2 [Conger conger]|uniref:nuclear body protein SP140-like protein isoform X2 n=1 Tax=Conger conger TaxID=82655 RepID=UPI002A5A5B93|nr:nuclear body protein SP140-like protein isoform X2 [Conger conger]